MRSLVRSAGRFGRVELDRRSVLAGVLAAGASLALPGLAQAAMPVGRIDDAEGRSTGELGGSVRELLVRSDVFLQEIVQTYEESRLGMVLGRRSRGATFVRLGELTRLSIERGIVDHGGVLRLERGALLFDRPRGGGGGEPEVRTPVAVIAARGTRFFVGPSRDVVGVFVEEGVVDVTNRGGGVTLRAGEGTNLVSADIAPTPPVEWGAARIAEAMASVA